jgi:hypothetical protein
MGRKFYPDFTPNNPITQWDSNLRSTRELRSIVVNIHKNLNPFWRMTHTRIELILPLWPDRTPFWFRPSRVDEKAQNPSCSMIVLKGQLTGFGNWCTLEAAFPSSDQIPRFRMETLGVDFTRSPKIDYPGPSNLVKVWGFSHWWSCQYFCLMERWDWMEHVLTRFGKLRGIKSGKPSMSSWETSNPFQTTYHRQFPPILIHFPTQLIASFVLRNAFGSDHFGWWKNPQMVSSEIPILNSENAEDHSVGHRQSGTKLPWYFPNKFGRFVT